MGFLLFTVISLIALIGLPFKLRYLLILLPSLAFLILGLFVKDNPWMSRIQLPFFAMLPLCFIGVEAIKNRFFQSAYRFLIGVFALVCLSLGFLDVSQNSLRPITVASLMSPSYFIGDLNNLCT